MEETGASTVEPQAPLYPLSETGPEDTLTPLNAPQVMSGESSGPQITYETVLQSSGATLAPSQPMAPSAFSPPPFQLTTTQETAIKAALAKLEATFMEEYEQGVPESVLEGQRQALQKRMMAEYAEAYMKEQLAAYQAAKEEQETALEEAEDSLAAANAAKTAASSLMTQAQAAAGVATANRQLMVTKQQELEALQKTIVQLTEQRSVAQEAKTKAEAAREAAIQNATAKQSALAQAQELNERLLEDVEDYTEARDVLDVATAAYETAVEAKDVAVAAAEEARTTYTQKQTARSAATARVTQLEAEIKTLDGLVKEADSAAKQAAEAAAALTEKETSLEAATKAAAEAEAARVAAVGRVEDLDEDEAALKQLEMERKALQEALSRAEAELVTSSQIVADAEAEMKRLSSLKTSVDADKARLDTDIQTLGGLTGQIEQLRVTLRAKRVEADAAICAARDSAGILANATTARDSAAARLQQFTGLRTSIMGLIGQIETTKSQIVAAVTLVAQREKELAAAAPLLPTAEGIKKELDAASKEFTSAYQTFTTANDAYLTARMAADTVRNTDTNRKFENLQVLQNLYHLAEDARGQFEIDIVNRTFSSNCIVRYLSNAFHPNFIRHALGLATNNTAITVPTVAHLDSRITYITDQINDNRGTLPTAKDYFTKLINADFSVDSLNTILNWLAANNWLTLSTNSMPHRYRYFLDSGIFTAATSFIEDGVGPGGGITGGVLVGYPPSVIKGGISTRPYGTPTILINGQNYTVGIRNPTLLERYYELPMCLEALQTIRPAIVEWNRLNNKINSAANTGIEGTRDTIRQRAGERIREEIVNRPGLVGVTNHSSQGPVSLTTPIFTGTIGIFSFTTTRDVTRHPRASEPNYPLSVNGAIPTGQLPFRLWGLPNDLSGEFVRTELISERTAFNARENPTTLTSLGTAGDTVYPILNRIADTFNQYIRNTQESPPSVEKTTQHPPDWAQTQGRIVFPTLQLSLIPPSPGETKGLPLFPANTAGPLGINYSSWDLGYTPSPDHPSFIEWTADARLRTLNLYVRQLQKLRDYFGRIGLTHSPIFNGKFDAPRPTLQQRTDLVNRANQEINRMKTLPPPTVNDLWDRRLGQIPEIVPSGAGQPGRIVVATGAGTLTWAPSNTEAEWKNYRRLVSRKRFHPPCFITFRVESYAQGECHIGFSSAGTSTMLLSQSDGDYYLQIKPTRQMVRNIGIASVAEETIEVIGSTYLLIWTPTNHLLCYRNGVIVGGDPGGLNNRPISTALNNLNFYYNGSYKQIMIQSTLNGGPVLTDVHFGQIPGYTMSEFDRLDRGLVTLDRINRRIRDDTIYQVPDKINNMPMYATSVTATDMTTLEQATYAFIENASKHYRNIQNARTYRLIIQNAIRYLRELLNPLDNLITEQGTIQEELQKIMNGDPDIYYRIWFSNSSYTTIVRQRILHNWNVSTFAATSDGGGSGTIISSRTPVNVTIALPELGFNPAPYNMVNNGSAFTTQKLTDLSNAINVFTGVTPQPSLENIRIARRDYDILKANIPNFIAAAGQIYTIDAGNTAAINAATSITTRGVGVSYNAGARQLTFTDMTSQNPIYFEKTLSVEWDSEYWFANPTIATRFHTKRNTTSQTVIARKFTITLRERFETFQTYYDKLLPLHRRRVRFEELETLISNTRNSISPIIFNYVRLPHLIPQLTFTSSSFSQNNTLYQYLANNTPTGYTAPDATNPTQAVVVNNFRLKNWDTDANGYIAQNFTNPLNTSRAAVKRTNFRDDREALSVFVELMREQINDILTDMNTHFGNYLSLDPLTNPPLYVRIQAPAVTTVPFTTHTMTNALAYINGLITQYNAVSAAARTALDTANASLKERRDLLPTQEGTLKTRISEIQALYAAATGTYTFDGPESGPRFTTNDVNLPMISQQLTDTSSQAATLVQEATTDNTTKQAAAQTQIQAYRSLRTQLIAQLEQKDLKLRELARDFAAYLTNTAITVTRTPVASGPFADAAAFQETGANVNVNQAGGATTLATTLATPSPLQIVASTASGPICSSGPNALEPEATINYATLEGKLATINTNINNYLIRLTAGINDLRNDLRVWNKIKRVQTAKKTTVETAFSGKAAAYEAQQKLIVSTYQPTPAAVRQDLVAKTGVATQTAQQQVTTQNQRDTAATTKTTKDEASSQAIAARNTKLNSIYQTFNSALQAAASGAQEIPTTETITQIHKAAVDARDTAITAFQEATTAKSAAEKEESAAITAAEQAQTEKVEAQETYMTNLRELYLQYGPNVTLSVTGLEELPDMQLASGATPSAFVQGLELIQEAGASGSFGAFMLNTFLQRSQAYEQALQERTEANETYTEASTALTTVQATETQATQAAQEKVQEIATTFNNQTLQQLTAIEQTATQFAEQKMNTYQAATETVESLENDIEQIGQQIQQSEIAVTTATQMSIAAQASVATAEAAEDAAEEEVEEVYVARVEESRATAEGIRLEESRAVAEGIRLEESRATAEVARLEESRAVAETIRIEESRAAAESKAEVERLEASRAVAEVQRLNRESMAIATMIEENRVAEESRAVASVLGQQARREALQKQMLALLGPTAAPGLPSGAAATDAALEQSGAVALPLLTAIVAEIQQGVQQLATAQTALTTATVDLVEAEGDVTRISAELKLIQAAMMEAIRVGAPTTVVQQLQIREQQLLQELSAAQETVALAETAIVKLQAQVEELETFLEERQQQQTEAQNTFRTTTLATIAEKEVQLKAFTENIQVTQKTVQELVASKEATEKELAQVVAQLETAAGPQRTMLLATKARLEKEVAEIQESIAVAQQSLVKLQASAGTLQQQIQALQGQIEAAGEAEAQVIAAIQEQSGAISSVEAERAAQVQAAEQEASAKVQQAQESVATMVEEAGIAKIGEQIREQQAQAEQQLALAVAALGETASQANILESGATQLSSIRESSKEIEAILTQLTELQTAYVKATVQEAQAQGEVERIQVELESLRVALLEAIRVGAPQTVVSQLQMREKQLVTELTGAQGVLATVQTTVKTIQAQITTMSEVLKVKQEEQATLEETVRTASLSIIQQREKQLDAIENSIERTETSLQSLTTRKAALEKELDTVQVQLINATGSQRQILLTKQNTLQQEISATQSSIAKTTSSLAQLQQSAASIQTEIQLLQQQFKTITAARNSIVQALEKQMVAVAAQERARVAQLATIQTESLAKVEQAERAVQELVRHTGISEVAIREAAQKRIAELGQQKQEMISTAKLRRAEARKVSVASIPIEHGVPSVEDLGLSFKRALSSIRAKLTATPVQTMVPGIQQPEEEPEEEEEEEAEAEAPSNSYGYGYGYGNGAAAENAENTVMTGGANINGILGRLQSRLNSFKPENPVVTTNAEGKVEEVQNISANANTTYGEPVQQGGRRRTRKVKNTQKK